MPDPHVLPISVIVPAYNRETMIARAIASVRAQDGGRVAELIVVDDRSEDDTASVAGRLGARVVRHAENRGAATARNTGIAAATQEWIALLDSDDEWLPHLLATLWPLRDGHALVAGAALQVGDDHTHGSVHGPPTDAPVLLRSPLDVLLPFNPIPASGVIVRRAAVVAAGGYDTSMRFTEDWDLWIRVLEQGTGIQTPQVVSLYHRHAGQKTKAASRTGIAQRQIAERYAARDWWSDSLARRRAGVLEWDGLRRAARERRPLGALAVVARIASDGERVRGVAGLLGHRLGHRRRRGRVLADGRQVVVALGGRPGGRRAAPGEVVVERRGAAADLLRLALRPPARVQGAAGWRRAVLRAARVPLAPRGDATR